MNDFAGATYDRDRDFARLKTQLRRVHALMLDGQERTLHSIAMSCGGTEAAVSARLRDLRKSRFGSHVVQHRRITGGQWEYRLLAPTPCNCPVTKLAAEERTGAEKSQKTSRGHTSATPPAPPPCGELFPRTDRERWAA